MLDVAKKKRKPEAPAPEPEDKPKGKSPWSDRIASLQDRMGLNNEEFALRLGVSVEAIRTWKYRNKIPSRMAQKFIEELEKTY